MVLIANGTMQYRFLSTEQNRLSIEMIPDGIVTLRAADSRSERRQVFIDAARTLFFALGYAGTAMSTVATKVGGSKTTLWTYFPSKQDLFAAVVDDIVERYGSALEVDLQPQRDVEDALRAFGAAMMATVLSPPILDLHRLVIGEAGRFPEIGQLFYERGAKRGKAKLATFIASAMSQGRLRNGDPMVAAQHFAFMCQSGYHQLCLFGVTAPIVGADVASDVDAAIDAFMRAWKI